MTYQAKPTEDENVGRLTEQVYWSEWHACAMR